jgi:hypothetical protein
VEAASRLSERTLGRRDGVQLAIDVRNGGPHQSEAAKLSFNQFTSEQ